MALQIRRGTDAERTAGGGVVFADGELVYVTDTDALYVGDGATAGGVKLTDNAGAVLGSYITADTINSTLDLQQNLDLNGKDIIGTGNINISGTINATGNVNIGDDANTDTVDFAAQITSSLTPNADATYDLGTSTLKWNNIHAVRLDGDVEGSVFGDDSGLLVDAVNNKIVGVVDTTSIRTSEDRIALGDSAGATNQGNGAVAIGNLTGTEDQGSQAVAVGVSAGRERQGSQATALGRYAGQNDQGISAVAVGHSAARESQGAEAIAIGKLAGETNQAANSIVLNATGSAVENTTASSLVVKPVRDAVGTTAVMYNATSGEVTHTALPEFDIKGDVYSANGDRILQNGVQGAVDATLTGNVIGALNGTVGGTTPAAVTGTVITANSGFTGNLTGNVVGNLTGDLTGSVFADDSTLLIDAVAGNIPASVVSGTFTGNVTGDTTGTHTGNILTTAIDSADSSAITFTPGVEFESSVSVDQDVTVGAPGADVTQTIITPNKFSNYNGVNLDGAIYTKLIGTDENDNSAFPLTFDTQTETIKTATFYEGIQVIGDQATSAITLISQEQAGNVSAIKFNVYTGVVGDEAQEDDAANFVDKTVISTEVADFGTAVKFASMTTTVRDALTATAGMVVFNTTDTKLQVYTGATWADLH